MRERADGSLESSLVQDSGFGKSDFHLSKIPQRRRSTFDYGTTPTHDPAEIPTSIADKIQQLSKNIFETLNLSGIARIDFLYQPETQELFANEINPMPGTLYHHLWKKSGVETGAHPKPYVPSTNTARRLKIDTFRLLCLMKSKDRKSLTCKSLPQIFYGSTNYHTRSDHKNDRPLCTKDYRKLTARR